MFVARVMPVGALLTRYSQQIESAVTAEARARLAEERATASLLKQQRSVYDVTSHPAATAALTSEIVCRVMTRVYCYEQRTCIAGLVDI